MDNNKDIKMVLILDKKYIYEAEIEKWNELRENNPIKEEVAKLSTPIPAEFSCKVKRVLQKTEIKKLDLGERISYGRAIDELRRSNSTLQKWLWEARDFEYQKGYKDAIRNIKLYAIENYPDIEEIDRFLKNFEEDLEKENDL